MSTEIANAQSQALAQFDSIFNIDDLAGDLTENVAGGFPIVSIRGSKFHVKFEGTETDIVDDSGDARSAVEVVILKANKHLQKTFYAQGFEQGSNSAPDCFSNDGRRPNAEVMNPVNADCASCPKNQWGSRITDAGTKAKACSDSRRIAIVPADDILNQSFNGAMLLRVPAASLKSLQQYGKACAAKGLPYNSIVTKLSFDSAASYPKLVFTPVRQLDDAEKVKVAEVWPSVDNVLEGDESTADTALPTAAAPATSGQPKLEPVKTEPAEEAPVAEEPAARAAPVQSDVTEESVGSVLDDIMADLDS